MQHFVPASGVTPMILYFLPFPWFPPPRNRISSILFIEQNPSFAHVLQQKSHQFCIIYHRESPDNFLCADEAILQPDQLVS